MNVVWKRAAKGVRAVTDGLADTGRSARAGVWILTVGLALLHGVETSIAARWRRVGARPEAGMATAEYAIVTLAAVAFAGLLLVILRGGEVREMLLSIIREALSR